MIELGQEAKDKITGFSGILTARVTYLYGCDNYGITPTLGADGKTGEVNFFDEGRIVITGRGVLPEEVKADKPGGYHYDCPGKQG